MLNPLIPVAVMGIIRGPSLDAWTARRCDTRVIIPPLLSVQYNEPFDVAAPHSPDEGRTCVCRHQEPKLPSPDFLSREAAEWNGWTPEWLLSALDTIF